MSTQDHLSDDARMAAAALLKETRKEERTVEAQTGEPLEKGADRVEERSKSSDGKSAGTKQESEESA